jgi:hypothetical protein
MPSFMSLLAAVALVSAMPCALVPAQQVPISAGAHARVEWTEAQRRYRAVGTVLELRNDSLALMQLAGPRMFGLARLERIDVRVPRSRRRGAARGAGIGALAGIAVGVAVGGYGLTQCRGEYDDMCGLGMVVLPPLGAIAGLTLGAVIGGTSPGRRWQRVR